MTDREYLIALAAFVPFGPARLKLLVDYFTSAKKVWSTARRDLEEVGLSKKLIEGFVKHRDEFDFKNYFASLEKMDISVFTQKDKSYPKSLLEIPSSPVVLYIKGDIKKIENAVAIVGSRKMTSYGKEVTEIFSRELAQLGLVIVSGLARGIDTAAHKAALSVKGRTVAVLGCGLDSVYPPENTNLAKIIVENGGALISEYPLKYPALPINFAARNRIVSGLSRAIVVVEGRRKSGTLLTASAAADQGKTVFAVPGEITSPMSEASYFLIQNGAKMATSTKDILDELHIDFRVDKESLAKVMPTTKEEKKIVKALEKEPLHLDEVVRMSNLEAGNVMATLTGMEMKGIVKNLGQGRYKLI